jgi:hypothetical protein
MPNQQTDGSQDSAKSLLEMLLRHSAELDAFLISIEEKCSEEEFKQLRAITGKVMGSILVDAINPIVAQYPDLKPSELK